MIYVLAIFLPPLGLLLNGQPLAAILNVALIVPCILLGLIFHVLWLVPSLHAVISVYMKREQRRHREIVDAINLNGFVNYIKSAQKYTSLPLYIKII